MQHKSTKNQNPRSQKPKQIKRPSNDDNESTSNSSINTIQNDICNRIKSLSTLQLRAVDQFLSGVEKMKSK